MFFHRLSAANPAARLVRLAMPVVVAAALLVGVAFPGAGHAAAQSPEGAPPPWPTIALEKVADGFSQPVFVTHAGDGSGRLFVLEKVGRIIIIDNGVKVATPYLDIESKVKSSCGECGLLGLAFPPSFAADGYFFVSYTAKGNPAQSVLPDEPSPVDGNDNVLARYRVSAADPNLADSGSEEIILTINQPYQNHNGGDILFGPDELLYFGVGDGGNGGDPLKTAQNLLSPLGKILRIEVGATGAYTIPADNPFITSTVGGAAARPEIWAYGVRNPWRFSFDSIADDLWMGDVGQNKWEEVDYRPAGAQGGENYGWSIFEGAHCYPPATTGCDDAGITMPVHEYGRSVGQSITGGYVYRGIITPLRGIYVYGDFSAGKIFGLRDEGGAWQNYEFLEAGFGIPSFGEGPDGALYVVDFGGSIQRITVPAFVPPNLTETVHLPLVVTPE